MRKLYVVKRNGTEQAVNFEKISERIRSLCSQLNDIVDPSLVTQKVGSSLYAGVTTGELDELAAETSANLATLHPDYVILAARIAVSNLHKSTKKTFYDVMRDLYEYVDPKTDRSGSMINEAVYQFIEANKEKLSGAIVHSRDGYYDYFGYKTLERSYLLRINGFIVERPQHMLMRVACGIHCGNVDLAIETYNQLSERWFTHASPTLFNAATNRPQLSSCFLLTMKEDSIDGIYETLQTCALISKSAGGIGLSVHNIRANGAYIRGSNGYSNGLIPMLRVFNSTARYVDQGGKRKGAFAMYLEPWHADVREFLDLRKNHGVEEARARDLFYGLWIPDLFMKRVEMDGLWSLMCPDECPGLPDVWGEEFDRLYTMYERQGKARETVKARAIWSAILQAQQETGTPYILFKDACNRKSNQQNLGTIKSSNLCTEIVEYTSPDEVAVCNLASIALSRFVVYEKSDTGVVSSKFDFAKLIQVTKAVTKNLNKIIDINYYPVPEARKSNLRHRPIGLGVQGLADTFMMMKLPYESEAAQQLNRDVFATLYYAALESSCELAQEQGPYPTYEGSPVSKGILQYDMWDIRNPESVGNLLDWASLKKKISTYGVRNSLLVAPMPTASTSQILGNNESFEPYTSNLYIRRTMAGEFICVNKHLLRDLMARNLWKPELKDQLVAHNGSVQNIAVIPADLKELYKTVWEMKGRTLIDMAADRGAYIDQSQSFNVHMENVNYAKLTSLHFYAWKKGLKTGMYYLRTKAAVDAIKFTLDPSIVKTAKDDNAAAAAKDNNSNATLASETLHRQTSGYQTHITAPANVHMNTPLHAKSPLTKDERIQETNATISDWRKAKARFEQSLDDGEGCTMCSG